MTITAAPKARRLQRTMAVVVFLAAALITATVPVAVGLVFLVSAAVHRPALAVVTSHSPARPVTASPTGTRDPLAVATVVSGLGLLLIGAGQGIGAVTAGLSITTVSGFAARDGLALLAQAALAAAVTYHLRRAARAHVP